MENSYSKVRETKAFKILEFIELAGEYGRSFSEIQEFIVTLNGRDWNEIKLGPDWKPEHERRNVRINRGYYCTILVGGMHYHQGLLHTYCVKLPNGRWTLTEEIWTRENLNYQHGDPRSNTKTWQFNEDLKRGRWERWRDNHGHPSRRYP
jgi:hypothetical protein